MISQDQPAKEEDVDGGWGDDGDQEEEEEEEEEEEDDDGVQFSTCDLCKATTEVIYISESLLSLCLYLPWVRPPPISELNCTVFMPLAP